MIRLCGHNGRIPVTCNISSTLNKKYKLLHQIDRCNELINKSYARALKVCDVKKPIELQPDCRRLWRILESVAVVKSDLTRQLEDVDKILDATYFNDDYSSESE